MDNHIGNKTYYNYSQPTVPGLKVAYGGNAASRFNNYLPLPEKPKGWFSRLKDSIIDLVTEEAEADRPIGISQLSRNTFTASDDASRNTIVRNGRPMQDYRFNQLIDTQS